MMCVDNKDKYRELCRTEKSIPIFSRDWWLDAACGKDNWDVIIVENGGNIVASLPYTLEKKYGFYISRMPILTQKLGPWIRYPEGQKYSTKLEYEKKIFNELIKQIPSKIDLFLQAFDYSITNWLPFYWNGFKQTTRYTYVLDNLHNLDVIKENFSHSKRQNLKKAEKSRFHYSRRQPGGCANNRGQEYYGVCFPAIARRAQVCQPPKHHPGLNKRSSLH